MTSLLQKITIPVCHVLIFSELTFWQWNEVAREAEIPALDIESNRHEMTLQQKWLIMQTVISIVDDLLFWLSAMYY